MARSNGVSRVAQAWIELKADDPEAVSALGVARARLSAGRRLLHLRRARLIELLGVMPERDPLAELLHRSTQFYNPSKEGCRLRANSSEPVPVAKGMPLVLVYERGGERRVSAERWWRHETGQSVEVREGVAWAFGFEEGCDSAALAVELTELRDRRRGLLCNPNSQEWRLAADAVPFPWITSPASAPARKGGGRGGAA